MVIIRINQLEIRLSNVLRTRYDNSGFETDFSIVLTEQEYIKIIEGINKATEETLRAWRNGQTQV